MIGSRGIPGQRGGVERVLEAVCPRLVKAGDEVRVYSASWSEYREPEWQGVRLLRTASIRHKYFDTLSRSFLATLKEIFNFQKTILHYHASGSAPLVLLARLFGKKVVVTVHGLDWQRRKWNLFGEFFLKFGEWAACRLPHRTIAVSQQLKRALDERYKGKVIFIPNGAEPRRQRNPEKIKPWGLGDRNYILFLARLVPEKRSDVLLDAFLSLPDKNRFKLVIAGPSWHSEEYVQTLKQKAQGHPDVIFTGEVDEETLEELYSNCYSYVLPSEVEGMSLSLLDAMAFGACIVASDIAANADVVADCGMTFRTGDAADLAGKLDFLIKNPVDAQTYRVKARNRLSDVYNWDKIALQWQAVYDELG